MPFPKCCLLPQILFLSARRTIDGTAEQFSFLSSRPGGSNMFMVAHGWRPLYLLSGGERTHQRSCSLFSLFSCDLWYGLCMLLSLKHLCCHWCETALLRSVRFNGVIALFSSCENTSKRKRLIAADLLRVTKGALTSRLWEAMEVIHVTSYACPKSIQRDGHYQFFLRKHLFRPVLKILSEECKVFIALLSLLQGNIDS